MCTLAEELSVRTHRLQPVYKRMQQVAERMTELERDIQRFRRRAATAHDADICERELAELAGPDEGAHQPDRGIEAVGVADDQHAVAGGDFREDRHVGEVGSRRRSTTATRR